MATCPNGHDSTWDDYCSSCGAAMGGAAGAEAQAATGAPEANAGAGCPNCAETFAPTAVFCENCGYDFLAGSMPGALSDPDPTIAGPAAALDDSATPASDPASGAPTRWELVVSIDRAYFDRMSAEGQLDFPDPLPDATTVDLSLQKALLGRRSESRGVFPEIDVLALTGDPAVSTRHAMLERQSDGTYTITDLSSTNGTYLGDADTAVTAGVSTPLGTGDTVYLGAWTKVELRSV